VSNPLPIPRYIDSNGIPMQSTALERHASRLLRVELKTRTRIERLLSEGPAQRMKAEHYKRDLEAIEAARRCMEQLHAFLHAVEREDQQSAIKALVAQAYEPDFDALSEQVLEEQKSPAREAKLTRENGKLIYQPGLSV
jgi:hypothetical protein